ncbi:M48 family metalloprotease [Candidatus Omnitrophota bacterium]
MPFSFFEIEEKKSKVIFVLFAFLVFFYFFTAWLLVLVVKNTTFLYVESTRYFTFSLPTVNQTLLALALASLIGVIHWTFSTYNLIQKLSFAVDAKPIDPQDTYHQYFKNIVDEVSVAVGGRKIEANVIPSSAMNAFALADFEGRAVIGVTEGLLSRLSRAQIEAVVGHEAGHIISGDCLTTTVACSLSELYRESFSKLSSALRGSRGRGSVYLFPVLMVLGIMNLLNKLLNSFISRQREYRADAIAVRLTRDPMSLAQALKIISNKWHGAGIKGENLESIFIVSPQFNALDDREGFGPDFFSTHPPMHRRISILLNIAHEDEKTLEENIKNMNRASPVAQAEFSAESKPLENKRWFVFRDSKWQGPFDIAGLKALQGFLPTDWIKLEGQDGVRDAFKDEDIARIFEVKKGAAARDSHEHACPHCHTTLSEIMYEGAPVLKCQHCEGTFVGYDKISRILIRKDKAFSQELAKIATLVFKTQKPTYADHRRLDKTNRWIIGCPKCHKKMRRQYFVYSYPVEIDRCWKCNGVWFDKQELEILQYIFEHKDKFFDGRRF